MLQIELSSALIGLREMIERYGLFFYELAKINTLLREYLETGDENHLKEAQESVKAVTGPGTSMEEMGLKLSNISFDRLQKLINKNDITREQLKQAVQEYDGRLRDELDSIWFMHITGEKVELYNGKDLFGVEVSNKFPLTVSEIEEAGKSLSVKRSTSCVFHLMRVLEIGLTSLAKYFNVSFERRNWENIINDIEAKIKNIGPSTGSDWKQDEQFYSEVAIDFRYFKNAWRNHVMHVRNSYSEESAMEIFNHVRSFMQHLATRHAE